MNVVLNLLADVRWRGAPVAGDRPRALLAALAARGCRPVRTEDLIGLVWGDDAPRNEVKSLQVLVARTRNACGADAIVRDGGGYRLGATADEVDSIRLARLVRDAAAALDQDAAGAAKLAQEALALADGLTSDGVSAGDSGHGGPLADVRQDAVTDVAAARVIAARARSRTGAHAQALPVLEAAHAAHPHDEALLDDLLNAEAAVRGPGEALTRFERYRSDLRDRLGTDPGEVLRRTHRRLLSLDRPVRRGIRYDATELIGRDGDLERLRALLSSSRVVSIVGAGGLGKTRLANALARDAAEPFVYVVELAGVTAAEDAAVEVGSVLGVRDSVRDRKLLTAKQRADVQARIAQHLSQSPCLLLLDNCEHLIGAVADLVAYLVTTVADLRVLTTSRAPLSIAAERVYLLGELEAADSERLFTERALAARPGARLPSETVASIVARLDGLPLAIELAAAKVRAMSAEEIDRRLEDRFALLRGGDRSAPDRHQALLTVIEWSWNLLSRNEQRALRRLALFHDGFTLQAAEAVLDGDPDDAFHAVQGLVSQSLLGVRETSAGLRYRMLETVREFGVLRLADAGEEGAARSALRRWAAGYALAGGMRTLETGQFDGIDMLAAEETNLSDELREAINEGDRESVVQLLTGLGTLWTLRGEHARLLVLADTISETLRDWEPPPELADAARISAADVLSNSLMAASTGAEALRDLLQRLGPGGGPGHDGPISGLIRAVLVFDLADMNISMRRLERMAADDQDRSAALMASLWLSQQRENSGDIAGAMRFARRSLDLTRDEDNPWGAAMAHAMLTELSMHLGGHATAVQHARAAFPVMARLGALDDEVRLRSNLILCDIALGRLHEAEEELVRLDRVSESASPFAGGVTGLVCRAELALARGDRPAGLRLYRESATRMRELHIPGIALTGMEPWALFGTAAALTAYAHYSADADESAQGRELFRACQADGLRAFRTAITGGYFDYPVGGMLLFALGTWTLLCGPSAGRTAEAAAAADDSLRLLVLADRFGYNRSLPSMAWERVTGVAEKTAPGRLAQYQSEYGKEPADLLTEACRLLERLRA